MRAAVTTAHFRLLPGVAELRPVLLGQEGLWGTPAAHHPGSWHRGQAGPLAASLERVEGGEVHGADGRFRRGQCRVFPAVTAFTQLGQWRVAKLEETSEPLSINIR